MNYGSARPARRIEKRGFVIGWVSITLVTALIFAAFAGPLLQNGQADAIAERISAVAQVARIS